MATKASKADIAKMPFETAMAELEGIVSKLEAGDTPLEESIDLYERGALLKAHCEAKLKTAQEKIEKIVVDADGTVGATPTTFD